MIYGTDIEIKLRKAIEEIQTNYSYDMFLFDVQLPNLMKQNVNLCEEILSKYPEYSIYFDKNDLLYLIKFLHTQTIDDYIKCRVCQYCNNGLNKIINFNKGYHSYCCTSCSRRSPLSQKRYKKTLLEKYGSETYNNTQKNIETCLKRYNCVNVFQREDIKQKCKETKLEKYGDEKYTNTEKRNQTCLERYGTINPLTNKEVYEKMRENMIKKYGAATPMEIPEFREKHHKIMMEKYNTINPLFASVHRHYKESKSKFKDESYSSKKEYKWLQFLKVLDDVDNRQKIIGKYSVDGYVYEDGYSKVIFEFLGDYWHGHPCMIEKQPTQKDLFIGRFNKTLEKFKYLFEQKYVVCYIWEHDWDNDRHLFGRIFDGEHLEYDMETEYMNYPLYMYPFGKYPHHIVENPYIIAQKQFLDSIIEG